VARGSTVDIRIPVFESMVTFRVPRASRMAASEAEANTLAQMKIQPTTLDEDVSGVMKTP